MEKVIQNAVEVNGVIYKSVHVHDFVSLPDERAIDGGNEYVRILGEFLEEEQLFLFQSSSEEEIRNKLVWGTYGADGKQPLSYIKVKDMSLDHITAVFKYFEEDRSQTLPEPLRSTLLYWKNKKSEESSGSLGVQSS